MAVSIQRQDRIRPAARASVHGKPAHSKGEAGVRAIAPWRSVEGHATDGTALPTVRHDGNVAPVCRETIAISTRDPRYRAARKYVVFHALVTNSNVVANFVRENAG